MVDLTKISAGGKYANVDASYAGNFQGLLNDLTSQGYQINSLGGYNYRNIAGTSTLSKHATGDAIDINPSTNPVTYGGASAMQTDIPNASSLAQKWGLKWGGDFSGSKRDTMHFETTSSTTPIAGSGDSVDPNSLPDAPGQNKSDLPSYDSLTAQNTNASSDKGAPRDPNLLYPDQVPVDAQTAADPRWKEADTNGDGQISWYELKQYNLAHKAQETAASAGSTGSEGTPSTIPKAIVTAANQQSEATVNAAQATAKAASADAASTNATNTGIWQGLQTWAGGRLLQIMVFIVAAIFLLIGLYMFTPRNVIASPSFN